MAHDNPSYCFKYIREVNNIRYTNINLCKDETLLNTWFNAMSPLWKIFRNSRLEIQCQLQLVLIIISGLVNSAVCFKQIICLSK